MSKPYHGEKAIEHIVKNCEKGHKVWTELIVQANLHKAQGFLEKALELYTKALEQVIHLVELIELSLELKIPALHHFTLTTQALAELYEEKLKLPEEAERLLLTHYICLKKVVTSRKVPLKVRDLARQEIFHSQGGLVNLYQRHERVQKAEHHKERCHEIYYMLLS